jgi:hypothetical protein
MYDELKKKHPGAVLAVFRDGAKGYDPANPDKVYAGTTSRSRSTLPTSLTCGSWNRAIGPGRNTR